MKVREVISMFLYLFSLMALSVPQAIASITAAHVEGIAKIKAGEASTQSVLLNSLM
jgi:hypothetical protein